MLLTPFTASPLTQSRLIGLGRYIDFLARARQLCSAVGFSVMLKDEA